MVVSELLTSLGVPQNIIYGNPRNMELDCSKGYDLKISDCNFNHRNYQAVTISPNVDWTDGSCRPAYGGMEYTTTVYLTEKFFSEGKRVYDWQINN